MMILIYVAAFAVVAGLAYLGIRYFVSTSAKFGGGRVIICPENGEQAMVEVDARRAALTNLVGPPQIRLESCWRWPLHEDCGQECLLQLDVASPECLVSGVLMKWYKGKNCAFCHTVFDEPHLIDHKPALLTPSGITAEWSEFSVATLMDVLKTHRPVCWNCHIAQTFRREHPELVIIRQPSCVQDRVAK